MAAQQLVGCRFRLHGRDPATGLDCIGVLAAALAAMGRAASFPSAYSLRTRDFGNFEQVASANGFACADGPVGPGDVLLVRAGPAQLHIAVAGTRPGEVIEAHAGLRRVVRHDGSLAGPVLKHWRLRPRQQD